MSSWFLILVISYNTPTQFTLVSIYCCPCAALMAIKQHKGHILDGQLRLTLSCIERWSDWSQGVSQWILIGLHLSPGGVHVQCPVSGVQYVDRVTMCRVSPDTPVLPPLRQDQDNK